MRNLASVQKVIAVEPIEGADRIEIAKVLGWQVVTRKGEFKVGDLGVYFEVDSVLPESPQFEFMKDRKYRIKTIKLKGQLSQGLLLPLSSFSFPCVVVEGSDVTDFIGVKKYDPPETQTFMPPQPKNWWWKLVYAIPFLKMFRKKVGTGTAFPTHLVPKTDEPRLQAFPKDFLETYKDLMVSITQKMDGTSATYIWYKRKFSLASRNVWFLNLHAKNVYTDMAVELDLKSAMKKVFGNKNIAIQGEIVGPSIQDNKYKFDRTVFFLFGAYDIDKQEYLTPDELNEVYNKLYAVIENHRFTKVDEIRRCPIKSIGLSVNDWLNYASSKSRYNPKTWDEGIVIRSLDNKPYGIRGMTGKRWSAKVVSNEFLLQYGL